MSMSTLEVLSQCVVDALGDYAEQVSTEKMNGKDTNFDLVLSTVRKIHYGKGLIYGEYSKNIGEIENCPHDERMYSSFMDLKRKFNRILPIIKNMKADELNIKQTEQLLDTYIDLSVYALMGVVELAKHKADKS